MKTIHQLSISEFKMLLLTGNIQEAYKARNHFCLSDRQNSRHFFKLGDWRTVKNRACLLRFSALNLTAGATPITAIVQICSVHLLVSELAQAKYVTRPAFNSKQKYEKLATSRSHPSYELMQNEVILRCYCREASQEIFKDL